MIHQIIATLTNFIVQVISSLGYFGVGLLMFLESCGVPVPSEIIMPFAGFLTAIGKMNFWLAALVGAVGNLLGSLLAYGIGYRGGRPLIERWGRYILISRHDLDVAETWFARKGDLLVFIGRLLPVVRTYISFPAGIAKMSLRKFIAYTFFGALPWCLLFAWFGVKLQNNWLQIHEQFKNFDYGIVAILISLLVFYVYRHLKQKPQQNSLSN